MAPPEAGHPSPCPQKEPSVAQKVRGLDKAQRLSDSVAVHCHVQCPPGDSAGPEGSPNAFTWHSRPTRSELAGSFSTTRPTRPGCHVHSWGTSALYPTVRCKGQISPGPMHGLTVVQKVLLEHSPPTPARVVRNDRREQSQQRPSL